MKRMTHYAVAELYAMCLERGKEIERLQRRIASLRRGHRSNNAQRIALMRELPPRIEELVHQVAALTQTKASQLRLIERAEILLGLPVTEWPLTFEEADHEKQGQHPTAIPDEQTQSGPTGGGDSKPRVVVYPTIEALAEEGDQADQTARRNRKEMA